MQGEKIGFLKVVVLSLIIMMLLQAITVYAKDDFELKVLPIKDKIGVEEDAIFNLTLVNNKDTADEFRIIIIPARTRQFEQAQTFFKTFGRIRMRIQENMLMIKRCKQASMFRQKHAIAKNIARHIPNAHCSEVFLLNVFVQIEKMPLD